MQLVGNVANKNALICDDMIATGGTILTACKLLKDKGAKDIYIAVALPYFSKEGYLKFEEAYQKNLFNKVIGSNSVFWSNKLKEYSWYEEIDISSLFAQVIYNLHLVYRLVNY